jgi:hypothetical protein
VIIGLSKEDNMKNKLDLYDTNRLKDAREIIQMVYEYNWFPSTSLTKKLDTILSKLNKILEDYGEEI